MARLTEVELSDLKKKYRTNRLYSWSKIDSFSTDRWVYFLRYVKKVKADNRNGAYAVMGGIVHDLLQEFYENDITNEYMVDKLYEKYDDFVLKGYKFDKGDEEKNEKIANSYVDNCVKFLRSHKKVEGKTKCEAFVPLVLEDKNGNIILQCYIDFLNNNGDVLNVTDYKTSTLYSKKNREKLGNQLKIYGVAIHKAFDIPIEKIRLNWNFLKYVSVDYQLANGNWKTRYIERKSIGEGLKTSIKTLGKKLKYTQEEIEGFQEECSLENSIECLPENLRDCFIIKECLVEVEFTENDVIELGNFLLTKISEIEELEDLYTITQDEMLYWQNVTDSDLYRLNNLCDYSLSLHLPFKEYLDKKAREKFIVKEDISDDDLDKMFGL